MLHTLDTLIIAVLVSFYWARVIKLVRKTRRKTGHSAQFLPEEKLGRALRLLWYPTVTLWVLLPWLSLVGHPPALDRVLAPLWRTPWVSVPAVTAAVLAMIGTLICWRKMGSSWRMGISPGEKTQLILSGPYAYVRHPIYALSSLLMLASAAIIASPLMLLVAAFHLFFLQWEARREEQNLLAVHPDLYQPYMHHTGRFIPISSTAYVPPK